MPLKQLKIDNVIVSKDNNKLSYLLPEYFTTYKFILFKKRNAIKLNEFLAQ